MKSKNHLVIVAVLLLLSSSASMATWKYNPMITRHDKDEAEFFKIAERFEKYMCHLNLPDCEGTIIADQWAITAAHCAVGIAQKFNEGRKHYVIVNDVEIEVDKVIMPSEWSEDQLENTVADIGLMSDLALVHLKTKPDGALQAKLYEDEDEVDKLIYMVGRGAQGDGLKGIVGYDLKQRGATNRIETATAKWLTWTFDHPDTKTKYLTEYEGISGPGDSGGPAFIVKDDIEYIAGISSFQDTMDGPEGLYGVVENYTRVSQFIEWINEEMAGKSTSTKTLRVAQQPNAIDYKPKAIHVDPATLKQYVGEYDFQGVTMEIYSRENGTKLYTYVSDQPPYELIPTANHTFASKAMDGFTLEFKKLKKGLFQEVYAIQPNGTFKANRKK